MYKYNQAKILILDLNTIEYQSKRLPHGDLVVDLLLLHLDDKHPIPTKIYRRISALKKKNL